MADARGAGDIDAAMNGLDPGGAGIRHDNAGRAEDGQAAHNAKPGIERALGDFFAARNRDLDDDIARGTEDARNLIDRGLDLSAGPRVDGRLTRGKRQPGASHSPDAL